MTLGDEYEINGWKNGFINQPKLIKFKAALRLYARAYYPINGHDRAEGCDGNPHSIVPPF